MKKGKKVRLKYLLTFIILGIVIFFNWKEIPIQDNFVDVVMWLLISVVGGFVGKEAINRFGNKNNDDMEN